MDDTLDSGNRTRIEENKAGSTDLRDKARKHQLCRYQKPTASDDLSSGSETLHLID